MTRFQSRARTATAGALAAACMLAAPFVRGAAAQSAVPLVVHDPYFSAWSTGDRLTDDWPRHWSGATMGMTGMVRVDGAPFRWCGPRPERVPAAEQVKRTITPTATEFEFLAGGVRLTVVFFTPASPGRSLAELSQSVTAVCVRAQSADGAEHRVQVYLDATGEWCSDVPQDQVQWSRLRVGPLGVLRMGTTDQPVLRAAGDMRTIDWGSLYLATDEGGGATGAIAASGHSHSRAWFAQHGSVPDRDDLRMPRAVDDDWPVLAASIDLGAVGAAPTAWRGFLLGYDEASAIEYFERPLRPLWKGTARVGIDSSLLQVREAVLAGGPQDAAAAKFAQAAERVGGAKYAALVSLAYRQVLAGHKIVGDWDGTPLMFSKENTSNGCIATIDVIYPASPFYLYHDPEMLKAQLRPLLAYAQSPRWKFPFAPHDLGTYPKANGQVYGGGETSEQNQMPVEESGNMLIMMAAIAQVEGNADFARPHLALLEKWAGFLKQEGLDPVNQLCTDDFAGHMARNANLSAKTCVALGAYAQLLAAAGQQEDAKRWRGVAEEFARRWMELAKGGDATVLAFGTPTRDGKPTWSQKYNLVWDQVLGLKLFPESLFAQEVAWYRAHLGRYGLPLDSRMTYTKLDWSVWSACLTRSRADFDALMAPVYAWMEASPPPSRVPMSDWFETTDGRTKGMHSRTVVGGVWMPLLMAKLGVGWK